MPHTELLESAMALFTEKYVFPDKAASAAADVRARQAAGDFDGLDEEALSQRVTAILAEHCRDKHLKLRPGSTAPSGPGAASKAELDAAWEDFCVRANHGVHRVERLPGNVGYVDLRLITSPSVGAEAIDAAMTLIARCDALIFDVRKNGGGDPLGAQLWHSHLFPDAETHLTDNYDGNTGQTRQTWSLAHVPGPRYLDKPVWVLVGGGTFSGGEEFAYNLQALGRATIVGATTLGGAHVFEYFPLSPTMEFIIPFERAVNPVTGTNWEGTGVEPDVAVSQDEAFDTAYRAALEHVSGLETHPSIHTEAAEALAGLKRPAEDLTSMRNDIDNLLAEDTDNL